MKTEKEKFELSALKYAHFMKLVFESNWSEIEKKKFQRSANQANKRCFDIFVELRKSQRISEIEEFMHHNDPFIRCLTAPLCLYSDPETAEKVLEDIIETSKGVLNIHALLALKAWRKIPLSEDRYK